MLPVGFAGFFWIAPFPALEKEVQKPWGSKKVSLSRGQEILACSVLRSLDVKKSKMLEVVIEAVILAAEI